MLYTAKVYPLSWASTIHVLYCISLLIIEGWIIFHSFLKPQGHHLDLRLVRNQWLLLDPKIEFLMSEANEDKTSGDFREMGLRLAQEVISFLKKKMDKASRHGVLSDIKLSFVGHSIGNVIIRTALAGITQSIGFCFSYILVVWC